VTNLASNVITSVLKFAHPRTEKLANTERHLDISKGHVNRVEDKQDELKQLNRSIFRPVITFNKEGKRAAQEAKLLRRHEDEREEHEKAVADTRESHNRIGKAQTYGRGGDDDDDDDEGIGGYGSGRFKPPADQARRKEERKRYQFEATASDDELEDELDDNLGEIGDVAKRLKALGTAMGQELDNQNVRLKDLDGKTGNLDQKLFKGTRRVRRSLIICLLS
jgi:protein transport protein SEC9